MCFLNHHPVGLITLGTTLLEDISFHDHVHAAYKSLEQTAAPHAMKRKRLILAAGGGVLLLASFALFGARGGGDVSRVSIGFAGYGGVDGQHSLILMVTNGSSYRISQPDGNYELSGESADGAVMNLVSFSTDCGSGTPEWGWRQLRPPKIPCVVPGATFRFTIPVDERPCTWHVTVPFSTIPFRDRFPFALRSRWPSSKQDTPISFKVSSPPIPPAPSQILGAASVMESRKTPE